jgi:hypothetical protein
LHQIAIGAGDGTQFIPDSNKPETRNSLRTTKAEGHVEVVVSSLDALASCWDSSPVGLLKIDVEGFELDVFHGAVQMLTSRRPRLIMFESLAGRLYPEIASVFADIGYRAFQLGDHGRPDWSRLTAQNLFAVPTELAFELDD